MYQFMFIGYSIAVTKMHVGRIYCFGAVHKRRRQSLGGRGWKWAKIANVYYAKTANIGDAGVKYGGNLTKSFMNSRFSDYMLIRHYTFIRSIRVIQFVLLQDFQIRYNTSLHPKGLQNCQKSKLVVWKNLLASANSPTFNMQILQTSVDSKILGGKNKSRSKIEKSTFFVPSS